MTKLPDNIEQLSKEELMALLRQQQEEVLQTQSKLSDSQTNLLETQNNLHETQTNLHETQTKLHETRTKFIDAKKEARELAAKYKQEHSKNEKLSEQMKTLSYLTTTCFKQASEITERFHQNVIHLDEALSKDLVEQVELCCQEYLTWANKAIAWFAQTPFNKGRDFKNTKAAQKAVDEAKKEFNKVTASLKNSTKDLTRLNTYFYTVLSKYPKDKLTPEMLKAIEALKPTEFPTRKAKPKTNKGKVAKNRAVTAIKHASANGTVYCHGCGSSNTVRIEDLTAELLSEKIKAEEIIQFTKNIHECYVCRDCGHVSIIYDEEQDLSVQPNRNLGINSMVMALDAMFHGIPLERCIAEIKKAHELGNDTFSYNLHDYIRVYLKPLSEMILATAKEAKCIVVDETVFDCLEAQGVRDCKTNKEAIKNGQKVETHSTNYMLAITSQSRKQSGKFCVYKFMKDRSYESISKILTDDFKYEYLSTDAYPGYDKLIQSRPQSKLQNCLIHFRREVLKAYDPKTYSQELNVLNEDEIQEWLHKEVDAQTPRVTMYTVFTLISKIYACESSVDYTASDSRQQILKCRAEQKSYVESIDSLMTRLSEGRIKEKGTGKYVGVDASPYTKACVYYANQKDKLKVFLDEPDISPDTNTVEGLLRPVTVLRKNINWKASTEYIEDLAIAYTVFQTAKVNGIEDIKDYLHKYSCALNIYCQEAQLTIGYAQGKPIDKKYVTWDMKALSKGFDFAKWDLTKQS